MNILLWKPLFASFVFSTAKCRHGDYPQREGVQRGNKHVFTVYLRRLIFFFLIFSVNNFLRSSHLQTENIILEKTKSYKRWISLRVGSLHPTLAASALGTGLFLVRVGDGPRRHLLLLGLSMFLCAVQLCSMTGSGDNSLLLFFSSSCARLVSANCSYKGWDGAAQVLALVKVCASCSFISKVSRSQITMRASHSLSGKVSTVREINE